MTLLTILEELIKGKTLSEDRKTCLDTLKKIQPQIPNSVIDTKSGILLWGHTNLATTSWLINTHLDVVPGSPKQFSLKRFAGCHLSRTHRPPHYHRGERNDANKNCS